MFYRLYWHAWHHSVAGILNETQASGHPHGIGAIRSVAIVA
jgi:hypothetical protein